MNAITNKFHCETNALAIVINQYPLTAVLMAFCGANESMADVFSAATFAAPADTGVCLSCTDIQNKFMLRGQWPNKVFFTSPTINIKITICNEITEYSLDS